MLQQMRHGSAASEQYVSAWHLRCYQYIWRQLVDPVGRLGLAVAVPILVGATVFTSRTLTRSPSETRSVVVAADRVLVADIERSEEADHEDAADGFVDMYGNEVTDAVATYTFDKTGSLYELHSPQTELPRLGIPKS
jgi:hypothetical protein